jgi:hypothetical protein
MEKRFFASSYAEASVDESLRMTEMREERNSRWSVVKLLKNKNSIVIGYA